MLSSTKGLASRRAYAELAAARTDIELRSSILKCVGCSEVGDGRWKLFVEVVMTESQSADLDDSLLHFPDSRTSRIQQLHNNIG